MVGATRMVATQGTVSLFDRFGWLYSFFRNHIFSDHTERIIETFTLPQRSQQAAAAPWHTGAASVAGVTGAGAVLLVEVEAPVLPVLLELGCGPGFYACRLARRLGHVQVAGVHRSSGLLRRARERASALGLHNCGFEQADVRALPRADKSVDAVVASRVFTVVQEPDRVLAEAHRVLRPGGSCFIAEPRPGARARLPLQSMWLLARVLDSLGGGAPLYAEPRRATMLDAQRFRVLLESQPWGHVHHWVDTGYQCALCRKASTEMETVAY